MDDLKSFAVETLCIIKYKYEIMYLLSYISLISYTITLMLTIKTLRNSFYFANFGGVQDYVVTQSFTI